MLDQKLIHLIRDQFALDWHGIHGVRHWVRVRENGLRLCELTGAKAHIVELFAFLHDSRRLSDGKDTEHGRRAAEFVGSLAGSYLHLAKDDLALLMTACRHHSEGLLEGDMTLLTCWDADRLDLGRVGDYPDPTRLCTIHARNSDFIRWCFDRSTRAR